MNLTNMDDISGQVSAQSITFTGIFSGNGYNITAAAGSGINLQTAGILQDATVTGGTTNTLSVPLTLTAAAAITNLAGTTLAVGSTVNNGGFLLTVTGTGTINLNGIVSGGGGLTKTGTNTVGLFAANTYTGLTTVGAGVLLLGGANSLPNNDAVNISAGTLQLNVANALPNGGPMNISAAGATLNLNGNNATVSSLTGVAGALVTLGAGTLTTGGDGTATTFSGNISGTGGLTKVGSGTFSLAGTNTYSGATSVNTGTVQASAVNAFSSSSAVTVAAMATLDLNNNNNAVASLAGAGNVTLGTAAGGTLTTGGSNNATTFSGVISGTGGLTKVGTGIFTLSGANSYTGATMVNAGTLQAGAGNAFPSATAVTVASGATLDVNNQSVIIGSLAGAGNVTLGRGSLNTGGNNTGTTFSGSISGTGSLVKNGTGTFVVSGTNTYSGATNINAGTLQLGPGASGALPSASAVSIASGGTLDLNNNNATISSLSGPSGGMILLGTGTLTTGGTAASVFGGVIQGAGSLVKIGTGTLTLTGANAYAGSTTINSGTLQMGAANALPAATLVSVSVGSTLDLNSNNLAVEQLAGLGNITLGNGTLTVGHNNSSSTFSGVISGAGGLTKDGTNATGTLTLANISTYTGATTINAGALTIAANNALGNTAVTVAGTLGATLNLNSFNLSIGSLAGPSGSTVTLGSGTLTTGGNNTSTTFSGVIAGSGGLVKTGTGTFTLAGGNTYTGTTSVSSGILIVNGPQVTSPVTVSSGATLAGTGRVGTITTSGTVSPGPGANQPGQFFAGDATHSGNTVFSTGSTFSAVLNGTTVGVGYSQLNVTGTVALSGSPTLNVTVGFPSSVGDVFVIITGTGALSGTFAGLADGAVFTASGMGFRINYNPSSNPNSVVLTHVAQTASMTMLTSSATTTVFGQSIMFTATVTGTGGTPTGTVQFRDGSMNLGAPQMLTGGTATLSTTALPAGMHSITAVYSGDSTFAGSTSNTVAVTVNQAMTNTALTAMPNPSAPNQNVTFTATVTAVAPGGGMPTGTVQFRDGGNPLGSPVMLVNGVATFVTSFPTVSMHTISAVYSGDMNFMTSASPNVIQNVTNLMLTTTTVTSSAPNSVFGQTITFTATVAPMSGTGTPTGTVQFRDGTTNLGSPVTLTGGMATFTVPAGSPLSVGPHSITAVYSGDATFAGSTSNPITQTVSQASTTTALTSTPNPSAPNQNVTFTATVTALAPGAGTPTGTVQFRDGGNPLGSPVTLVNGVATLVMSFPTVSTHTISAVYSGDTNFSTSTSPNLIQTVTNLNITTTVVLSSVNPSVFGQSVTFTATVTSTAAGTPTGTVTFNDGSTTLGSSPLDSRGMASFTTTSLSVGAHSITAVYSGDTSFATSTAAALTQTVGKASTSVALTSSANPATPGQSVTFTATVSASSPGSGTPSGTVTFMDGSTTLGTGTLSGGQAVFTTSSLSVGSHTITAVYGGDANFNTSTSAALTQTISAASSSNRNYVTQLYRDILGRSPEQAGLDFWAGALDRNTMNRSQVSFGIGTSLEARMDQVQALYNKYLGRAADPTGLNLSVLFLGGGGTAEQLQAVIISSPEYFLRAGGNNAAYVDAVFRDVLNRPADADARNASIQFLANGDPRRPEKARRQLIDMVFSGTEYRQDVVQGFYQKFLGRAADTGGLNTFVTALQQGARDEQVVQTITSSDEYFSRAQAAS
jgi:autotransporter-associated beta strand protein